ncbi:polyprenyl synthetase family protein [Corynebacterium doosanense]|uniref:Geranylgeranyl pyrophosphate synthase n=1 Tax=Corynebacterium doosanense CAU 212 = DSM 45436 TaxID=558173 RepID=A0A097IH27_9CORY|nr:geranylgeranyl pyrophosphate synthase [Corynebacterium doosanense CAU 212 = DSM 45436]
MSSQSTPGPRPDPATIDSIPDAARAQLAAYIEARRPEIDAIGAPVTTALEHLADFVLGGGKRIRPLYGWAGFVGAGGLENSSEDPEAVLRAVSSLEFIQACALVHDDIIDSSETRRGRPTVHRAVAADHRDRNHLGEPDHYGLSAAILIGDLALAWADDMFADSGISAAAFARAREPWRGMRTEVIGGQLLDISLESSGSEDITLSRSVNRYKTAAYTIERPLHIGAALAGADEQLISSFRGYGHDIGIAFQLRDDLLGVFGDPALTGKPAGDDLREGKRTELLSLALADADRSDPAAAAELRAGVGTVDDPADITRLADIIASTGAPEQMEQRIEELTRSGLAHLDRVQLPESVKSTLHSLAIRSTERRT